MRSSSACPIASTGMVRTTCDDKAGRKVSSKGKLCIDGMSSDETALDDNVVDDDDDAGDDDDADDGKEESLLVK